MRQHVFATAVLGQERHRALVEEGVQVALAIADMTAYLDVAQRIAPGAAPDGQRRRLDTEIGRGLIGIHQGGVVGNHLLFAFRAVAAVASGVTVQSSLLFG